MTKEQELEIHRAYRNAGKILTSRMSNSRGAATQALLNSYAEQLYTDCKNIMTKYATEGLTVPMVLSNMQDLAAQAGLDTTPFNGIRDIIGNTGQAMLSRLIRGDIYKDGKGLSERIWHAATTASNDVRNVIAAGMAQNMGAAELSKLLSRYVKPEARKQWDRKKIREKLGPGYAAWNKNLEYNALRLARTTLSHSFTMGVKEAAKANPFLEYCVWNSACVHGRTCQQCYDRDGVRYKIKDVPFDHPNGLCWLTYETPPIEDMADRLKSWMNGGEDKQLDSWYKNFFMKDPSIVRRPAPLDKKMTEQELRQYIESRMDNVKDKLHFPTNGYYQDFLDTLARTGDEDYIRVFCESIQGIDEAFKDGRSCAYYSPSDNTFNLVWGKIFSESRDYNIQSKWTTFFHENGHRIDHILGNISANKQFQDAMMEDIPNVIIRMKFEPDMVRMMMKDHNSNGVQDIMSAIRNMKEGKDVRGFRTTWSHSDRYWKRRNVYEEAASELFADISQTHALDSGNKDTATGYMKEYFPNSYKAFKDIIKKEAQRLKKMG